MPYGETSKILRLLTRDLGLQSAIARGARRGRARTGPRLDLFTEGVAALLTKPQRELNPLTDFDVTAPHAGLARGVERFAAAAALAELALKCAPADPHPDVFDATVAGLAALEGARPEDLDATALAAAWGLIGALGFAPALERCGVCGAPLDAAISFSAEQGGALCGAHRGGQGVTRLSGPDRAALAALVEGRLPEPPLDKRHAASHRRLLVAFVRHHLAEQRPLPALAFWDREAWNAASS